MARPSVLAAGPVFTALIGYLGTRELPAAARGRAEAVLFDVLSLAPVASLEIVWPFDDRARRVADALAADPADARDTAGWARLAGASERTLSRLFVAETGSGSAAGAPGCGSGGRWNCSPRRRR